VFPTAITMPPSVFMTCFDKGTRAAAAPGAAPEKCSLYNSTTRQQELARLGGDGDGDGDEGGGEGGGGVKDGDADAGGVSASAPAADADDAASSSASSAAVPAAARRRRRRNSATGVLGNDNGFDGLVFDNQTAWASLIPKVVWRGSDYAMLPGWAMGGSQMSIADIALSVAARACPKQEEEAASTAASSSSSSSSELGRAATCGERWIDTNIAGVSARWAAVLMSWKSGVGAGPGWIDAKFWAPGAAAGYESIARSLGNFSTASALSTEAAMSSAGLAAYRYHVDLGGGGGTTWMGTLQKLAMPGLLFHHETVMRDFYFDDIRPMVHYVPVKAGARPEQILPGTRHHTHFEVLLEATDPAYNVGEGEGETVCS